MSETILRDYLKSVEQFYKAGIATEHTYRSALQKLLEALEANVTALNEPKRVKCGAPDYVVLRKSEHGFLTIGYVEAKDVGVSLDKIARGEQMGRYLRALDNLILTDYLEFHWYVKGEQQMQARVATPQTGKSLLIDKTDLETVQDLLCGFLRRSPEAIRKPEDLARRMARLTHMIRDVIMNAFEQKEASDTLTGLYEAFKTVLLPELPPADFADMFAQTLAYGLFAARYNHKGSLPFNRRDAAREIPRTNPFLRKLFTTIAGADFEDEPFIGFVNELTQVLAVTDMDAVLADFGKRTRREDPIVHFYETFLAQYDPKLRELRGVYYTPEPVVSYIVRSVDILLREQFNCSDGLADTSTVPYRYTDDKGKAHTVNSPRVLLLDPACGTGTFLYAIVDIIRETYREMGNAGMWSSYVRTHLLPRLFGFELLIAPYAVAHLKLGMQLAALDLPVEERADWAYDFATNERLGLYLTNTLEQALGRAKLLLGSFISDEANEAAKVKQEYPVMVIVGNPPYSGHSANKGGWITELLHGEDGKGSKKAGGNYFEVDGKPLGERNPKYLNDDYVKFIRFAQWRIEQTGYGILAFVTNHGYLDNPTFRGMRQSLLQSFDEIYVLNLHGNSRKKEHNPDGTKDENVFDIQQGVAIGIFVKRQGKAKATHKPIVRHADLWGPREVYEKVGQEQRLMGGKYYWLATNDVKTICWTTLEPQSPSYLFMPQDRNLREEYEKNWRVTDILPVSSNGIKTHRDHFALDFDDSLLHKRIEDFRNLSIADEDVAKRYELRDTGSWKLNVKRHALATNTHWEKHFTQCLYRPFDVKAYFHHQDIVDRPRHEVMYHMLAGSNVGLVANRQVNSDFRHVLCTNRVINDCIVSVETRERSCLFPLYLYPDPNKKALFDANEPSTAPGGRRPNLSPAFIADTSNKLNMQFLADGKGGLQQSFGPEDVFDYMYAVFHSPTYRARYAEFLKIDFPRLPLTTNTDLFRALCKLGERLVGLHLMEVFGKVKTRYPVKGNDMVEKVEYLEPKDGAGQGRVYINKAQYFEDVPPEVWSFHVGGYQVCQKWLKDRKGRTLSFADIQHYQRLVAALAETIVYMERIDEVIEEHGGWPVA